MPNKTRYVPSYNPAKTDTPFGIFELFVRQYMNGQLAVMQPVEIVSIVGDGKFVNVRPLISMYNTKNEVQQITDADVIPNVPYLHPYGKNGWIAFPPEIGDQGLLLACNFDISNYKAQQALAPTASGRTFNWSDGMFLPLSFQTAPANLFLQNGNSTIEFTKTDVNMTTGTFTINGNVKITGTVDIDGAVNTQSTITASGDITAGTVSLQQHTHQITGASALVPPPAPTPESLPPTA